ncbi:MAG: GNAT family N-acetyltransferase [Pseudomonadota bacterium]
MLGLFFARVRGYIAAMVIALRPARLTELSKLSALCLRSKAVWGYDDAFLDACRDELTLTPKDVTANLVVAERDGDVAGIAQVDPCGNDADLSLLFVDPPAFGHGVGRTLFDWCVTTARNLDAARLMIDADPGALGFYERMGARRVGDKPSLSIPGRMLPSLEVRLI